MDPALPAGLALAVVVIVSAWLGLYLDNREQRKALGALLRQVGALGSGAAPDHGASGAAPEPAIIEAAEPPQRHIDTAGDRGGINPPNPHGPGLLPGETRAQWGSRLQRISPATQTAARKAWEEGDRAGA